MTEMVAKALSPRAISSVTPAGQGAGFLGVQDASLGLLLKSIHKLSTTSHPQLSSRVRCKELKNREGRVICHSAERFSQDLFYVSFPPDGHVFSSLHLSLDPELAWTFLVRRTMYDFGRRI